MSVVRCPSCGRAWDGLLCFACGHEAGRPVAAAPAPTAPTAGPPTTSSAPAGGALPRAPSSAFMTGAAAPLPQPSAQSPFARGAAPPAGGGAGSPHFAPLPPLPPLPRAPTGGPAVGVGAPPAVVGQPAGPAPGALRFPPSTGAISPVLGASAPAPSGPVPSPFGNAPAPITAIHAAPQFNAPPYAGASQPPPIVVSPPPPPFAAGPVTAPIAAGASPAPAARPAPIASFQPPRAPSHNLSSERAPTSAAAASATALSHHSTIGISEELTQDVERPGQRLPPPLRRLLRGPAAFPVVFLAGFLIVFVPAALALWRTPDAAELYAAGQYEAVVALVDARAGSETPVTADELVLAGHAYGQLGQRDRMVEAYAAARMLKKDIKDDRVVENLMKTLGDDRVGERAAAQLAEDWKGKNVLALLQMELQNEDTLVRHNALRAVLQRVQDPNEKARVRLAVARVDLRDRKDCALVKDALAAIEELAAKFPAVIAGIDLVTEVDLARDPLSGAGKVFSCYTARDVDRTRKAIAAAQKPN